VPIDEEAADYANPTVSSIRGYVQRYLFGTLVIVVDFAVVLLQIEWWRFRVCHEVLRYEVELYVTNARSNTTKGVCTKYKSKALLLNRGVY
jgi:hypothetical protein